MKKLIGLISLILVLTAGGAFAQVHVPGFHRIAMDSEPQEITKIGDSIVFPMSERRAHRGGLVVLHVLIDSNGVVKRVECESATSRAFYKAAAKGMLKIRFTRPVLHGKHIEVWIRQTLNFKLNGHHNIPGGGTPGLT